MRSPIRCPDRAILNALLSQIHNFVSVVRVCAIKCRLRCVSASCRCKIGSQTHFLGRTASGDSSGGENISRPGFGSGESSGFRSNARVCKFQAADHSVNARVVSAWLRQCCRFLHVPTAGLDTAQYPPLVYCRVFFCTLVMLSCGVRTLPAHASRW